MESNTTIYHFAKFDIDQGFLTEPMVKYGNLSLSNFEPYSHVELRVISNYSDIMDGKLAFAVSNQLFDITLRGPL